MDLLLLLFRDIYFFKKAPDLRKEDVGDEGEKGYGY
jgi:hypothetical protein